MINHVFPVVNLTQQFWENYDPKRLSRSRLTAMREAFLHRAVFTGATDEFLPENQRDSDLHRRRYITAWSAPSLTLNDPERWEDFLGTPFASQIVPCGNQAQELLSPALEANDTVRILDRYLYPFDKHKRPKDSLENFERLLAKLRNTRVLQVISGGVGYMQPTLEHGHLLKDFLMTSLATAETDQIDEIAWFLFPTYEPIHDRFFGFQKMVRGQEPPWHAVSSGYGLKVLQPNCGSSTFTRVSSTAFLEEWNRAKALSSLAVMITRYNTDLPGWTTTDAPKDFRSLTVTVLTRH